MSGEWMTKPNVARARRLWDEGVSMTAMGRALGCSKSSIAGFAHRNGFPPRPSPIGPKRPGAHPKVARRAPNPEQELRAPVKPQRLAVPTATFGACQWIAGDDRKTWTMCGVATTARSPYCLEHHRRVWARHGSADVY